MDTALPVAPENTLPEMHKKRVAWIDGARVVAILLVMQAHTPFCTFFNHDSEAGAVALFFLISGYFTKSTTFGGTLARMGKLIPFYVLWSLYGLIVIRHGFHFSWQECGVVLRHGKSGAMWFILYLLYFTPMAYIFSKLPGVAKGCIVAGLFICGAIQFSHGRAIHPCAELCFALSIFLLGNMCSHISPATLERTLFPRNPFILAIFPPLVLIGILLYAYLHLSVIPSWLLLIPAMWSMLGLAYSIEQFFPHFGMKLATMGTAVVFIYAIHAPTLRVLFGMYLRLTGTMPPHFISALFILFVFAGGYFFYTLIQGRSKLLDRLLFAR